MLGPEREVPRAPDRPSRARVDGRRTAAARLRARGASASSSQGEQRPSSARRIHWHQRPVHVLRGDPEAGLVLLTSGSSTTRRPSSRAAMPSHIGYPRCRADRRRRRRRPELRPRARLEPARREAALGGSLDGARCGQRVQLVGVVEAGRLGGSRGARVVVAGDCVEQLGADALVELRRSLLDEPQAEMDVTEQPALLGDL